MLESFILPFVAVALAELGDKSQLAILLLASRTKKQLLLLFGVVLGFVLVDGIAVIFGSLAGTLIPFSYVKIAAGLLFVFFGVLTLRQKEDEKEKHISHTSPFVAGFIMIAITEWGDKTQVAAAIFSARFDPFPVFISVIAAETLLAIIAIYIGHILAKKIDKHMLSKIAGGVFIVLGVLSLLL